MQNRQDFLLVLGKALVKYAAPSHRLESQLLAAARILEVELQTVHLPTTIIASFGNDSDGTSEVHVLCRKSQLALGALHRVHQIYRAVVHDEVSAKEAMRKLDSMLQEPPIYGPRAKLVLSFCLSALICPLAFGGSFVDMWLAGVGAFALCFVQTYVSSKSGTIYANVWDTTVTVGISFAARGLSSIRSQVFCYSAISSSAIIGILPGFLVLCSALELGSKNLVCGSVNLVYALIVTLFISFGLEIGSELFLLFDPHAHTEVTTLAARAASAVTITGTYIADPNTGSTLSGAFSFTNSTPIVVQNIVINCYRPPEFPWYLQPFPWWTQFFLVPLFALLCSLANQQPLLSWDLIVMVFISCVGYAANKIASMFIFNHSDIVSAIGAFAIGLLGNIYSRMLGGTAFTVMVPGVLFLVPSGLSQAGGINGQGDNGGIDTGYAMVEVVVGIVVGLFISQALVYILGNRKNAASFTF
ncbi:hypothetical protein POSPLADRAFT_1186288 [Postia placenta MAD-698-R-SB12]|uniref:Threonine/serine exporter-like N-terminal domain-containing protein n=1 Tax=Postia placenta MAD-698-R-SB12 TaxID=670580 RepID=A0A1X6MKU5_9APHY|nr:hypothetical protein POSPLADRAFT_1186288 [Postia placenta MAD-698-R-SB12]OSX56995.1 hypothetical protein POSPLADRAFT_1186288 [Postia placenta MAD-698-R-SB12]